jgi:hypothetical protein
MKKIKEFREEFGAMMLCSSEQEPLSRKRGYKYLFSVALRRRQ